MAKYKVLVVDDSAFMRKLISDLVAENEQFEVIATAKNGIEAVEKTIELKPDIITMDVEMPEMNGLEALKEIMRRRPTPVVMLSSLTQEGAQETILALEWGAVDFIRKPSGSISLDLYKIQSSLMEKLRIAGESRLKVISTPLGSTDPKPPSMSARMKMDASSSSKSVAQIVAIGTSTGGPRALQQVLTGLPKELPAPILIVQHMPPNFTNSLAQRLDALSEIKVKEAEEGDILQNGVAYIAPGGLHMVVSHLNGDYRIHLNKNEPQSGHRPSVDTLFESLRNLRQVKRHVVIMTGMGSDGARGMKALFDDGVETTIAEAEDSCVVYGMPRSAVELGCVKEVVSLEHISSRIMNAVQLHMK